MRDAIGVYGPQCYGTATQCQQQAPGWVDVLLAILVGIVVVGVFGLTVWLVVSGIQWMRWNRRCKKATTPWS